MAREFINAKFVTVSRTAGLVEDHDGHLVNQRHLFIIDKC